MSYLLKTSSKKRCIDLIGFLNAFIFMVVSFAFGVESNR